VGEDPGRWPPGLRIQQITKKSEAIKLRDKMLAKKSRGETVGWFRRQVLITDLLDDVLKSDIKPSTRYVWEKVIEKNIRPFFGKIKAQRLTTDLMDKYREKRKGGEEATRRQPRTLHPAHILPQRPQAHAAKSVGRAVFSDRRRNQYPQGFLTDEQYDSLRDELPAELKALFVTGYITGLRRGEINSHPVAAG